MKKIISTNNAPKAIGPYSQAILSGNTLYCSGQIAINPETGELILSSISEETHQVMKNILEVLKAAEMDFSNVVKCSIFMKDIGQYSEINDVYASYFYEISSWYPGVQYNTDQRESKFEFSCPSES